MSSPDVIRPFRWDIRRREQLGDLPNVELPETYEGFDDDLLRCSARAVAFAGDSDLVFVGRSPEPLFDLLSGLLLDTGWASRLSLLNVSLRFGGPDREAAPALRPYFEQVGFTPSVIATRPRTIALVDVVDTGETFGRLLHIVHGWAQADSVDWRAVARKIRIVGLTWRTHTSPKTWRWQQHAEWVAKLRPLSIKNVSMDPPLGTYLAAYLPKTSPPFTPPDWTDEAATEPARDEDARKALALAVRLFDRGRTRETRFRFAGELARQPAMDESWFRSLVLELKR